MCKPHIATLFLKVKKNLYVVKPSKSLGVKLPNIREPGQENRKLNAWQERKDFQ